MAMKSYSDMGANHCGEARRGDRTVRRVAARRAKGHAAEASPGNAVRMD